MRFELQQELITVRVCNSHTGQYEAMVGHALLQLLMSADYIAQDEARVS